MKANDIYDVTADLEQEFGPVGSQGWNKAVEKAREEYNADILLQARKKAGMTQSEVAKRIRATKSYISRIERGKIVPTVASFYRIVSALGMQVEINPIPQTV